MFGTGQGIRLWSRSTSKRLSFVSSRSAIQKRFKDALGERKLNVKKYEMTL